MVRKLMATTVLGAVVLIQAALLVVFANIWSSTSSSCLSSSFSGNAPNNKCVGQQCVRTSSERNQVDFNEQTIFVTFASYRDDECKNTLLDLYGKSQYPQRLRVAIVEQNKVPSEACIPRHVRETLAQYMPNIRIISQPFTDGRACNYPRYLASLLYRGEDYFMQIDSHTLFAPNWDTGLIKMLNLRAKRPHKSVITTYPPDFGNNDLDNIPGMCTVKFDAEDLIFFHGALLNGTKLRHEPYLREHAFFAGGFAFSRGELINEVPYDPNIPFLFVGEEILRAARIWTSGWDLLAPDENWLWHHYIRKEKPKYWDDNQVHPWHGAALAFSRNKTKYLLGYGFPPPEPSAVVDEMELFGMGKVRTIQQFWDFAGIDLKNKTTPPFSRFCP